MKFNICCKKELKLNAFSVVIRVYVVHSLSSVLNEEYCGYKIIDENQLSSAHNVQIQQHSNQITKTTASLNNRPKQLLLIKS